MAAVTGVGGAVVERYRYSDYGVTEVLAGDFSAVAGNVTQVGQAFGFTGRRVDFEEGSGLYYYRLRFYDPGVGRFVSRDPLGLWGDPGQRGVEQGYCGGNPVNRVDPLGNAPDMLDLLDNFNCGLREVRSRLEGSWPGDNDDPENDEEIKEVDMHDPFQGRRGWPIYGKDDRKEARKEIDKAMNRARAMILRIKKARGTNKSWSPPSAASSASDDSSESPTYKWDVVVCDVMERDGIKEAVEKARRAGLKIDYRTEGPDTAEQLKTDLASARIFVINSHGNRKALKTKDPTWGDEKWLDANEIAASGGGQMPEAVIISACDAIRVGGAFKGLGIGNVMCPKSAVSPTTSEKFIVAMLEALVARKSTKDAANAGFAAGANNAEGSGSGPGVKGYPMPVRKGE